MPICRITEGEMKGLINTVLLSSTLFLCGTAAAQQAKSYGNWIVDNSIAGVQIAKTINESAAATGVFCNLESQSCDAYLTLDVGCEDGEPYPMMINSSVGAYPLTTKCMHLGKLKFFVASEFESMIQAFESGGEIGFAMPMQNGQFKVVRFSTAGATPAIKAARTLPSSNKQKIKRRAEENL